MPSFSNVRSASLIFSGTHSTAGRGAGSESSGRSSFRRALVLAARTPARATRTPPRVLPTPGSPPSRTRPPRPCAASASVRSSSARSASRPTKTPRLRTTAGIGGGAPAPSSRAVRTSRAAWKRAAGSHPAGADGGGDFEWPETRAASHAHFASILAFTSSNQLMTTFSCWRERPGSTIRCTMRNRRPSRATS